jgi:hypothetical protein
VSHFLNDPMVHWYRNILRASEQPQVFSGRRRVTRLQGFDHKVCIVLRFLDLNVGKSLCIGLPAILVRNVSVSD